MAWNFINNRPIYTQLVEQIQRKVLNGEYPVGARLPGVREMAENAGVNPNTMQRALAHLEAKGLLYTQSTNGRFVVDDESRIQQLRDSLALQLASTFVQEMRSIGCNTAETASYIKKAEDAPGVVLSASST